MNEWSHNSHDAYDITRRELIATHPSTNNIEKIVTNLVYIILLKELHTALGTKTKQVTIKSHEEELGLYYLSIDVGITEKGKTSHSWSLITVTGVVISAGVGELNPHSVST